MRNKVFKTMLQLFAEEPGGDPVPPNPDPEGNGMTAEVEPTVEYAAYVELGTRYMKAQPYLKPAFEEQKTKFRNDMKKLTR